MTNRQRTTDHRGTADPRGSVVPDRTPGRTQGLELDASVVLYDFEGDHRWVPSCRTESVSPTR